ncbi:SNF1-interacting protein [Recurvomyces mirabilis]|uniref:SNF1-interacting protein n=1 Tax=Recurvomyces mirabilis TaxID=574656 RepID=UPI002DE14C0C|nr:SNF1-interacting protein [Recurvomyces mirabilis]
MGSSHSKDERRSSRQENPRRVSSGSARTTQSSPPPAQQTPGDRLTTHIYAARNAGARGSRPDLNFLSIGRDRGGSDDTPPPERVRETKQEKEARRVEKERQARVKERERSLQEESVDGGFLVTLGTYTGPEDFNKGIVRQLQLERRLAPFWKGLDDHNDSWTEAQLVAAVRGLPIPAADEVPAELLPPSPIDPRSSETNINNLTVPISSRSQSYQSDMSGNLSASHPAFSSSGPTSPTFPPPSSSATFRGRAKTLASLATGSKSSSDLTQREIQLPKDPYVNGLPTEAYLYRGALECPICFMYYPPYLNKTRCCDQAICSECFVQIKRPDPHPPEHEQPGEPRPPEEEAETLVSEIASCPFCVTPEFGVTYEAPPFRRGLAYANQANTHPLKSLNSAMSSSSSLQSGPGRRRATSLSASSSQVVTTDKVRPDWAKKLADARAHTLRRSAAATALHNAAYVLGNQGDGQIRGGLGFGRRRRTLFGDSPGASGSGTPQTGDGSSDILSARTSSRRTRVDDLEELMMMEAIRLSLAAEEDRMRKEDKEAKKDEKKKAKEDKKLAKQDAKLAKRHRNGSGTSLYPSSTNESTSSWAGTSMVRSTSNLGMQPTSIPEEHFHGKGKAPAQDFARFNPLTEPSSTFNTELRDEHPRPSESPSPGATSSSNPTEAPQRHLEASRATILPAAPASSSPIPMPSSATSRGTHLRQFSNTSSTASSFVDSAPGSVPIGSPMDLTPGMEADADGTPVAGTTPSGMEPMFNFRSLAAMIGDVEEGGHGKGEGEGEGEKGRGSEHVEIAPSHQHGTAGLTIDRDAAAATHPPPLGPEMNSSLRDLSNGRTRGDSAESSSSSSGGVPPPVYVEHMIPPTPNLEVEEGDLIMPAPVPSERRMVHDVDAKEFGGVRVLDGQGHGHGHGLGEARRHEATQ